MLALKPTLNKSDFAKALDSVKTLNAVNYAGIGATFVLAINITQAAYDNLVTNNTVIPGVAYLITAD